MRELERFLRKRPGACLAFLMLGLLVGCEVNAVSAAGVVESVEQAGPPAILAEVSVGLLPTLIPTTIPTRTQTLTLTPTVRSTPTSTREKPKPSSTLTPKPSVTPTVSLDCRDRLDNLGGKGLSLASGTSVRCILEGGFTKNLYDVGGKVTAIVRPEGDTGEGIWIGLLAPNQFNCRGRVDRGECKPKDESAVKERKDIGLAAFVGSGDRDTKAGSFDEKSVPWQMIVSSQRRVSVVFLVGTTNVVCTNPVVIHEHIDWTVCEGGTHDNPSIHPPK